MRLIFGDFNGDGLTDIALVRQTPGWGTIPIAFSAVDGSWNISNGAALQFIDSWAYRPGVRVIPLFWLFQPDRLRPIFQIDH